LYRKPAADVHEASSSAAIGVRRGRGRGRARGRGRGRESLSSIQVQRSESTPLVSALYGKNIFVWTSDPPAVGRRREQDIIRTSPGLTAAASANNISEAFQLFITHEIISHVVLQTNQEARRRIRDWNEQHPSDLRPDWNAVSDDEMMAFLGLCILAGAYRSRHEPVSVLWSDREGRPAFTATMSRNRCTDIRFYDKSTRESRLASDKFASFRDIWMFLAQLPKFYIPGTDLCVDEQLVAFRGRCGFRQYIPSKPAKYGGVVMRKLPISWANLSW
jgi:hypothetical protein